MPGRGTTAHDLLCLFSMQGSLAGAVAKAQASPLLPVGVAGAGSAKGGALLPPIPPRDIRQRARG